MQGFNVLKKALMMNTAYRCLRTLVNHTPANLPATPMPGENGHQLVTVEQ